MSDNELLLALSEMMDNKLNSGLEPLQKDIKDIRNEIQKDIKDIRIEIQNDIKDLKNEIQKINIILENEVKPDVKLLAENYLPSAIRYEKALMDFDNIKADVELLKKVVVEHSEKLQKIS